MNQSNHFFNTTRYGFLLLLILVVIACTPKPEETSKTIKERKTVATLDDELFTGLHHVVVPQTPDVVFKRDINFKAYPLNEVLIKAFPEWKQLINEDAVLIMRATGGYAPQMAFSDGFSGRAFIATQIDGRPSDQPYDCWQEGGEEHCDLGYYFIWTDGNYPERPQPWGTYELEVVRFEEAYGPIIPETTDETVLSGFETYRKYCLECHRINGLGGSVGTEHVDRSEPLQLAALEFYVLEYRKNNPSTYMPDFSAVLEGDRLLDLMAYINYMDAQRD